ncbi:MAG: PAS domain-containing sensor histidine kinase [Eudoraea sp.]|nr:PAS domain-containing sensor histidine kinase [Eudoraea sp.]
MKVFEKNSNIFKLLSEAVAEGILVVNKEQVIVSVNRAACSMFGYVENELFGENLNILIPHKFRRNHKSNVKSFIGKNETRRMGEDLDLYGLRKDGNQIPIEVGLNSFELFGRTYVMALIRDITERKKSREALSHWYNIFNESLNEIYVFSTRSLQFLNVNRGARKNIGYEMVELGTMTPADIKPEFDTAGFKKLLSPLLKGEVEKLEIETIHQRKDGSVYPVEVHLQLSKIGEQQVCIAIILDISESKSYTENLERTVAERTQQLENALIKEKELSELKTKFLSLVSHEFKTPLSSILTSTTLLGKYKKTAQQELREKHLETIKNKVKYLNNILNDFLSVERLESGKVNYNFTTFALSKVINEVVYDANMLLKEGQKINYPKNIDDIILEFDEKILELILSNLVHNSIKYSPENTEIDIRVAMKKDNIIISIKDHGMGIPEADKKFIFDRYFRAGNALLTQGTGIGLNIVKGHLNNLGGDVTFKSKENKGTTFSVQIPVKIQNLTHEKSTVN